LSPRRGPLCEACWSGLPRHHGPSCACGVSLVPGVTACGRCRRGLSSFAAGASLGPHEGALRVAVHELKYRSRRRVAGRLSEAMLGLPQVRAVLVGASVLVPVPLHPRRRRSRGFNQSELLAEELGRRAGIATAASALVRRTDTPPQTGLSAAARRANVRGAFAVRHRSQVSGRAVVLVDDVLTTGATASACARALTAAGAREVRLLTAARVV
jgi:competence protein ComFC